jgi:S-formylglutathione hydrolase FrmB
LLRHPTRPIATIAAAAALALSSALAPAALADDPPAPARLAAPTFEVTYTPEVRPGPVSARVYVMLGPVRTVDLPGARREPRFGPNWFRPQPFFAVEARDWKPGEPLKVGADAVGFHGPLDALEPGDYLAQAVVRLNPDTHKLGDGEGNAYGPAEKVTIEKDKGGTFALKVDKVVPPRTFAETDRVKLVEVDSPLLSAFHKRPIKHRAAVILPEGDKKAKRATLYIIPGFGGDHFMAPAVASNRRFAFGKDLIRVVLDPDCGTGHHVFADSAYNGPRGRALVEELIPHIEANFPAIAEPSARLVNGHSSGGWSSLWLQVTYPDVFGGVWSTSPDPVDFRKFQLIDIYAPGANAFKDREGNRVPLARQGTRAVIFCDSFSKMEDVIGDGGQLHSFEAVFSPLGSDGHPRPLWDRSTGAIDPQTARAWEKYDIRLVLERNWPTLGPKLKGKLHVVCGDLDTFYLEGAVKLLKESLEGLGSDAVVELVPGRDHGTVIDAQLAERFDREMNAAVGNPAKAEPAQGR